MVQLLISNDPGKRWERPEEDLELLEQIKGANSVAGLQFLEYLVFQKRSIVSCLVMKITICLIFLIFP